MKKTYYKKRGRRYYPVSEYDSDFISSFGHGSHLVVCQPGSTLTKHGIEPEYAPLIAAAQVARERMVDLMVTASESRPTKRDLTPEQLEAWHRLRDAMGDELCMLQSNSVYNILEVGIQAMIEEQERLMTNPSVRKAYEHYLTVVALTKDHTENA